jgi:type IV secretion system protein VirD4
VLYAEPDKTLAGVANFLSDPRRPIETTLRDRVTKKDRSAGPSYTVVAGR